MTTSIISSYEDEGSPIQDSPSQSQDKSTLQNEFPMFSIGNVEERTSEIDPPIPSTDTNLVTIQIDQSYAVIDLNNKSFVTQSGHNKKYFATHLLSAMSILQFDSSSTTLHEDKDGGETASAGASQLIDFTTQGTTDNCQDMPRPKPLPHGQTPSLPATTCTSEVNTNHLMHVHCNEAAVGMSHGGHHRHMTMSPPYFKNVVSAPTSYHHRDSVTPAQSMQNFLPGQPVTSMPTSPTGAMDSSPYFTNIAACTQNSLPGPPLCIPIPQNRSTIGTPLSGMSLLFTDNASHSTSQATSPGGAVVSSPDDSFVFLPSPITSSSHIMPPLIEGESYHHPTTQLTADTLQLPEPLTPRTLSPSIQSSNPDVTGLFQMSDINISIGIPLEPPPDVPPQQ